MIVSLSFMVSASPQMLRPFKLLKPPPPKPPKIPTINLRGINIPTRIVDERGRNFNPRRKGYESPIVVTINPPRTKVLTAPKIPGPSPVTDKRFLESQKKSLIHRHLFNNPLMRNLGSFPKENYSNLCLLHSVATQDFIFFQVQSISISLIGVCSEIKSFFLKSSDGSFSVNSFPTVVLQ